MTTDCDDPYNAQIVAALRAASDAGLKISVMHGNRDFLLGEGFAAATGATLLSDPTVLSTPEWQFVLSHGDALCLDDLPYMAFRAQVRNPAWQQAPARPAARSAPGAGRPVARAEHGQPAGQGTTLQRPATGAPPTTSCAQHGYATFIHGHTHLPATHDHIVDGIHVERWVMADWHEERGECLAWDGETLTRAAILPENRP